MLNILNAGGILSAFVAHKKDGWLAVRPVEAVGFSVLNVRQRSLTTTALFLLGLGKHRMNHAQMLGAAATAQGLPFEKISLEIVHALMLLMLQLRQSPQGFHRRSRALDNRACDAARPSG